VGIHFGGESSIDNLRKFTRYAILVQAFNSKGPGPSSSPLIATTLQDVPTSPPEKIECSATSPQSLHLRWDPPPLEARHGVIQGYKVEVLNADEEESETKVVSETELILHGLKKYSNYSFSVRGFTAVGEGTDSSQLVCRTDEDGKKKKTLRIKIQRKYF
jgi:Down syndrome cell adhesion protein